MEHSNIFAEVFGDTVLRTQNKTVKTNTGHFGGGETKVTAATVSSKGPDSWVVKESKSSSSNIKSRSSFSKDKSSSTSSSNSEHRPNSRNEKNKDMSQERETSRSSMSTQNGGDRKSSGKEKRKCESHNHKSSSSKHKEGSKSYDKKEDRHKENRENNHRDKKDNKENHQRHHHGDKASSKSSSNSEHRHHTRNDKEKHTSQEIKTSQSTMSTQNDGDRNSSGKEKRKGESHKHKSSSSIHNEGSKSYDKEENSDKKNRGNDGKDKKDDIENHQRHHHGDKSNSNKHPSKNDEMKCFKSSKENDKKDSSSKIKSSISEAGRHSSKKSSLEEKSVIADAKPPSNDAAATTSYLSKPSEDKKHRHMDSKSDKSQSRGCESKSASSHRKDSSHRHLGKDKSSTSSNRDRKNDSKSNSSFSKHKLLDAISCRSKSGKGSSSSRVSLTACVSTTCPVQAPITSSTAYPSSELNQAVQIAINSSSVIARKHLSSKSPSSSCVPTGSLPSSPSSAKNDSIASHHKSSKSSKKRRLSPIKRFNISGEPGECSQHSRSDSKSPTPKRSPAYYHRPLQTQLQQKYLSVASSASNSRTSATSSTAASTASHYYHASPSVFVTDAVIKPAASPRVASTRNVAPPIKVAQALFQPSSSPRVPLSPRVASPVKRDPQFCSSPNDKKLKMMSYEVSVASLSHMSQAQAPTQSATELLPCLQIVSPVRRRRRPSRRKIQSRLSPSYRSDDSWQHTSTSSYHSSTSRSRSRSKSQPHKNEFINESRKKKETMFVQRESVVESEVCYPQKEAFNTEIQQNTISSPHIKNTACIADVISWRLCSAYATRCKVLSHIETGNKFNPSSEADEDSKRHDTESNREVEIHIQDTPLNDKDSKKAAAVEEVEKDDSDDSDDLSDDFDDDDNDDNDEDKNKMKEGTKEHGYPDLFDTASIASVDTSSDDYGYEGEEEAMDSITEPCMTLAEGLRADEGNKLRRIGYGMSKEEEECLFWEGSKYVRTVHEKDGTMQQVEFADWFANDARVYYFIKSCPYPMSLVMEINTACRRLTAAENNDVLEAVYNCITANNAKLNGKTIKWENVPVDVLKKVKKVLRVHNAHLLEIDLS